MAQRNQYSVLMHPPARENCKCECSSRFARFDRLSSLISSGKSDASSRRRRRCRHFVFCSSLFGGQKTRVGVAAVSRSVFPQILSFLTEESIPTTLTFMPSRLKTVVQSVKPLVSESRSGREEASLWYRLPDNEAVSRTILASDSLESVGLALQKRLPHQALNFPRG